MAYINGEFKHEYHDITIEVLEPTKDEANYEEGMRIEIVWGTFQSFDVSELRIISKWFAERADFIENNFTTKGKKK